MADPKMMILPTPSPTMPDIQVDKTAYVGGLPQKIMLQFEFDLSTTNVDTDMTSLGSGELVDLGQPLGTMLPSGLAANQPDMLLAFNALRVELDLPSFIQAGATPSGMPPAQVARLLARLRMIHEPQGASRMRVQGLGPFVAPTSFPGSVALSSISDGAGPPPAPINSISGTSVFPQNVSGRGDGNGGYMIDLRYDTWALGFSGNLQALGIVPATIATIRTRIFMWTVVWSRSAAQAVGWKPGSSSQCSNDPTYGVAKVTKSTDVAGVNAVAVFQAAQGSPA